MKLSELAKRLGATKNDLVAVINGCDVDREAHSELIGCINRRVAHGRPLDEDGQPEKTPEELEADRQKNAREAAATAHAAALAK